MSTYRRPALLALAAAVLCLASSIEAESRREARMSLAGEWRFALDRQDVGIAERWFGQILADRIRLPGALQAQGYGDDVTASTEWVGNLHDPLWSVRAEYRKHALPGQVRTPFLLQPPKHYLGAAWYQRDLDVPASWRNRRVVLTLERAHWQTQVWLDDRAVGRSDALGTPHVHELGSVAPGRHTLTIRVDNRMIVDVGASAHSVSDYTQGAWNGIVGEIELRSTSPVWLDDVQVFPSVAKRSARVRVAIGNATGEKGTGRLVVGARSLPVAWDASGGAVEVEVTLGDAAPLWDEFEPALQRLRVRLTGGRADDEREVVFGLREIGVDGTQFLLNGRRIFLRGTHEGCSFPLTGHPPTDVESWRRIYRIARAHGLNHMRFHSWCPPEAAFVAADELGFYLQPECSIWAREATRIDPGSPLLAWLDAETARMAKAYGNHPSFVFLSHGNEPSVGWTESLSAWVARWKERDPRRLYAVDSGWPMRHELGPVTGTDYYVVGRIGRNPVRGPAGWDGRDYRAVVEKTNVPIVSHELGQHCAFPNFDEMRKYVGFMKPRNFEIFRDALAERGLLAQARDFLMASGKLQTLAYKEEIEACLRTPGLAGFQLLDLQDYPGQGTALVGVLDAFWEPKGYVTAEEYRRFCNTTVPLARLARRTFTQAESLVAEVEVAHFGPAALPVASPTWKVLRRDGSVVTRGALPARPLPIGNGIPLGTVRVDLGSFDAPGAYRLVVGLEGTGFENDWGFWVYPDRVETGAAAGVLVASAFDAETRAALDAGRKVLLIPQPDQLGWDSPPFGFVPVFWNRQLFPRWDRPLGLLVDPGHPALAQFPTEFFSDWQWEDLFRPGCRAINLNALPADLRPIVQGIDDWNRNDKLGLVFEARVLAGRLLVSAFDLTTDLEKPPAKRQLLASLMAYMASDRFAPTISLTPDQVESLFFDNHVMAKLGTRVSGGVEARDGDARPLIDGNPATSWTTPAHGSTKGFPHEVIFVFDRSVPVSGFIAMARQNERKRIGEIREYLLEASGDGATWETVARGTLEATYRPQRVRLDRAVDARQLRLTALSSYDGGDVAALAEFAVITGAP
jgi:beta-galactosidase